MVPRIIRFICFAFLVFALFGGCATTKPVLPSNIKRIAVPTFTNKTTEYGIETTITDYVIKQFLVDGRLEIVSQDKADALLSGTITKYLKQPLAFDVNNIIMQYRVKVDVDIKFTDLKDNNIIREQKNIGGLGGGVAVFNVSGSQPEPESVAVQRIYKELAEHIVNLIIYGWETY
jgi:hypothetical protein